MSNYTYSNISYGTDGLQLVDIIIPSSWNTTSQKGVPPKGVVLWIHGGGWSGGDKNIEGVPTTLANAGYIVVNANYRLTSPSSQDPIPTGFYPNNVNDIKTILRYMLIDNTALYEAPGAYTSIWVAVRSYVKQYGLTVSGVSAGGHLSIIGVFEHALDSGGVWPNAVINFVGPMNLYSTGPSDPSNPVGTTGIALINQYTQNSNFNVLSASPYFRRVNYQGISNYYTNKCKFYFWYNTNDTLVPLTSSIPFANALSSDCPGRVFITQATEGTPMTGSGGYPTNYVADHYVVSDLGLLALDRIKLAFQGQKYPVVSEKLRPTTGQVYPRSIVIRSYNNTLTLSPNSSTNTKLGNGNIKLTNGAVGVAYTATFSTAGGVGPYSYSSTNLPAGLTLDFSGNLSGTPTVQGYYYFTINTVDNAGETTNLTYQLTITGIGVVAFTPAPLTIGDSRFGLYPTTNNQYINGWYDLNVPGVGAGTGTHFHASPQGGVVINKEQTHVYIVDEIQWVENTNGFVKPTGTDLQAMSNYWRSQGKGTVVAVTPASEISSGVSRSAIWANVQLCDVVALDPYLLTYAIPIYNNGNSTINETSITNTINGLITWTQEWITLAQSIGMPVILITQGIVEPSLASYVGQYLTAQYSTFTRSQIKQRVVFPYDVLGPAEQGTLVNVDVSSYVTAYPL